MSQLTIPDFEIDVAHVDQIEDLSNSREEDNDDVDVLASLSDSTLDFYFL